MTALRVVSEPLRPFFTPKTLAAYLQISERAVRGMIASEELPSVKILGRLRVHPDDVDAWLDRHGSGRR